MRIVYMGTPDFAVGALEALIGAGRTIAAVVTQPDKRSGRKQQVSESPVKQCAKRHGLLVLQPQRAKDAAFIEDLRTLAPDVIVVAAYGQILPAALLAIPQYGCLNIHASLLPAYRGAAPIQWSILDGQKETGVTIMRMNEGLDTGDMMLQEKIPITETETGGSLHDKLSAAGARLIVEALQQIEAGQAVYTPQPAESTTAYAAMLRKEMGNIDWTQPAGKIALAVRAFDPWPGSYTRYQGKTLKIWRVRVTENTDDLPAGTVFAVDKTQFCVACGQGALAVEELQAEGKKRMPAADFLRGNGLSAGDRLGEA